MGLITQIVTQRQKRHLSQILETRQEKNVGKPFLMTRLSYKKANRFVVAQIKSKLRTTPQQPPLVLHQWAAH
jgi:hypothetical protein